MWATPFLGARYDPQSLRIVEVWGDSMTPEFQPGSHVIVRLGREYAGPGVYAIEQDGNSLIKRVEIRGGGVVVLSSTNEIYRPETLYPEKESGLYRSAESGDVSRFGITGKVVLAPKLY